MVGINMQAVYIMVILATLVSAQQTLKQRSKLCHLPPYPRDGYYEVAGAPLAQPGDALDYAVINVTCFQGTTVFATSSVICVNGEWSNERVSCARFCHLPKHPSVEYQCLLPGLTGSRLCNENEPPGINVRPQCRSPDYYYPAELPHMTCDKGGWDYVAICLPECGRVTPKSERSDQRGEVPWQAGIYYKGFVPYRRVCAGSLVSNDVVISAAHCFWNGRKSQLRPASEFAVAVGKLYRPWDYGKDTNSQKSNIKKIKIPSTIQGSASKLRDIAVLILETRFDYNEYVTPVCLDFDILRNYRQLQVPYQGQTNNMTRASEADISCYYSPTVDDSALQTFGWNTRSTDTEVRETLQAVKVDFITFSQCNFTLPPELKEYITKDMFCGGNTNGTANCDWSGEAGTGIAFGSIVNNEVQYFLRGVISTVPDTNRECGDKDLTVFTQIIKQERLILEALDMGLSNKLQAASNPETAVTVQEDLSGMCVLPPYPEFGTYEVFNRQHVAPGQAFLAVRLNVSCWEGYGVSGNDLLFCQDGNWSHPFPKCVRYCRLEQSPSVHYHCLVSGNIIGHRTCNLFEPPGTVVRPECNSPNYYSPSPLGFMQCYDGGWDYVATCVPECGRVTPDGWNLIIDGREARRGELPWHVGIYRKTSNKYNQICGGSLVTNTVVISAAHCFWKGGRKQPATNYAVAIGKLYRAWNDVRDEDAQKSEVKAIELPPRFFGSETNTQEDIAVLILETPFVYRTYIRPVCLNFDSNFDRRQLYQGNLGKVAGWGLTTENGNLSEVLKVVELPYVTVAQCLATVPVSFREKITGDKICAGYTNGTALCRGDSGGGLAFPAPDREDRYFLRGIVSTAPTSDIHDCNANTLTAFTHVFRHEHFVAKYLNN